MYPGTRLPGSTADRNGMKHAELMAGPGRSMIVRRRMNDVDGKHSAGGCSEVTSCSTAACSRRPAPTKAIPVGPVAAVERRPTPDITRGPDVSGAGIGDPASISVGVEVGGVLGNGWLPHLALPRHFVPVPVRVEVGPAVALVSFEGVACRRPVQRRVGCGLIASTVPLVPGILFKILRDGILAAV